jgi:hypothetical protein
MLQIKSLVIAKAAVMANEQEKQPLVAHRIRRWWMQRSSKEEEKQQMGQGKIEQNR